MNKGFLILTFILLTGLSLRLYKTNIPLLEFNPSRQIQTAEITRNFYRNGINILEPKVNYLGPDSSLFLIEFPLYNALVALTYFVLGEKEIFGRLMSIAAWVAASVYLYLIAKKLIGRFEAYLSLIFYTISPLSVLVSRSFQPDQLMLAFILAGIYYLCQYLDNHKDSYLFGAGLLFAFGIAIKVTSFAFLLPLIIFVLKKTKTNFAKVTLFMLLSNSIAVFWYVWAFIANKSGLATESNFTIANWFGFNVFLIKNYYANIFGFVTNLALMPNIAFLFVVGLFERSKSMAFLLSWLLGIAIYYLIFNKHAMTHEYYHLPILPVGVIFASIGLSKILSTFNRSEFKKAAFVFTTGILILVSSLIVISQRAYKPIDRFKSVTTAADIVRNSTEPEQLIIGSMDAGPSLVYYSDRTGWAFDLDEKAQAETLSFYGRPEPIRNIIFDFEQKRSEGAVVFATAHKDRFLLNESFSEYMYAHYSVIADTENFAVFDIRGAIK